MFRLTEDSKLSSGLSMRENGVCSDVLVYWNRPKQISDGGCEAP